MVLRGAIGACAWSDFTTGNLTTILRTSRTDFRGQRLTSISLTAGAAGKPDFAPRTHLSCLRLHSTMGQLARGGIRAPNKGYFYRSLIKEPPYAPLDNVQLPIERAIKPPRRLAPPGHGFYRILDKVPLDKVPSNPPTPKAPVQRAVWIKASNKYMTTQSVLRGIIETAPVGIVVNAKEWNPNHPTNRHFVLQLASKDQANELVRLGQTGVFCINGKQLDPGSIELHNTAFYDLDTSLPNKFKYAPNVHSRVVLLVAPASIQRPKEFDSKASVAMALAGLQRDFSMPKLSGRDFVEKTPSGLKPMAIRDFVGTQTSGLKPDPTPGVWGTEEVRSWTVDDSRGGGRTINVMEWRFFGHAEANAFVRAVKRHDLFKDLIVVFGDDPCLHNAAKGILPEKSNKDLAVQVCEPRNPVHHTRFPRREARVEIPKRTKAFDTRKPAGPGYRFENRAVDSITTEASF